LKIKTKIVSSHTADSKPVKQEVNGTVILTPLVFPGWAILVVIVIVWRTQAQPHFGNSDNFYFTFKFEVQM
jgi:hypothetical protein